MSTNTRYDTKNASLTPGFIHHRLGINTAKIVLQRALQTHSAVELAWWLFDKQWHAQVLMKQGQTEKSVGLYPDAFFALFDNQRQKHAYFFLEIDTGSEDHTKLIEKMKRYIVLATDNQLIAPYPPEEQIKGFRVLMVMHSEARRQNLLKRAQHFLNKKGMFHIALKHDVSLDDPSHVLAPIWKTLNPATDNQGRPLLPLNGQLEYASRSILE